MTSQKWTKPFGSFKFILLSMKLTRLGNQPMMSADDAASARMVIRLIKVVPVPRRRCGIFFILYKMWQYRATMVEKGMIHRRVISTYGKGPSPIPNFTHLQVPARKKRVTIQYNTIQYNTIQYNTIQYNTIHCSAVQCSAAQCSTVQYNHENRIL